MAFVQEDLLGRALCLIFVAGIGIRSFRLRRRGRSVAATAVTGGWLLPLLIVLYVVINANPRQELTVSGIFSGGFCLIIGGTFLGFLTGNLYEATFFLGARLYKWLRNGLSQSITPTALSERIDEASTPLEAPPLNGLPRRFGIRELLIAVSWASALMGALRALQATPTAFFMVLTFVSGVLIAQALLFSGRDPIKASMWAGAFLLPSVTLIVAVLQSRQGHSFEPLFAMATGCVCLVPAGIVLGAAAGQICGKIYAVSDSLLLWMFRGLPTIDLQPITEADIDVLLAWIRGPRFCQRWAGDQLTYPLDRNQLLARFATSSGDTPVRRIFKAVEVRTGRMIGYVEIGRIDRFFRCARLELPLVDPDASERGRLGVLLLRNTVEKAFHELGHWEISVVSPSDRSDLALCFAQAGTKDHNFYSVRNEADDMWIGKMRPVKGCFSTRSFFA